MCFYFDGIKYAKLQMAYTLLDKSQILMIDNLHVHYITAIYNTAFNIVNSFVNETDIDNADTSGKNPYKTLCSVRNLLILEKNFLGLFFSVGEPRCFHSVPRTALQIAF